MDYGVVVPVHNFSDFKHALFLAQSVCALLTDDKPVPFVFVMSDDTDRLHFDTLLTETLAVRILGSGFRSCSVCDRYNLKPLTLTPKTLKRFLHPKRFLNTKP